MSQPWVLMTALRGLAWGGVPVVLEVLGWDEAFLAAGRDATGLHCSVGIGDNKLRAKIATDFGKPRGTSRLTADTWFAVMGERPTTALWGIGSRTAKKLAELGIETVQQLADSDARVHGREKTFQEDLTDGADVVAAVRALTLRVVADVDREGRPAARVGLLGVRLEMTEPAG